ncbi:MAG: Rrf2 family transcriptional regulator, partial [Candidatus Cloacimonadota bacterium]|nr:Rrf2 family transcriptional regulator [Candidatus Cloacimonadota bacterium]
SLVKSVRGPKGGYFLNRPSKEISINDIMIALEDDFNGNPCKNNDIQYCSGTNCNIFSILNKIEIDMTNYFSKINLENILANNIPLLQNPNNQLTTNT